MKKCIHDLVNRCLTRDGKINVDITFASNTMILTALIKSHRRNALYSYSRWKSNRLRKVKDTLLDLTVTNSFKQLALLAIRRLNLIDEMLFTGSQTYFRNKEGNKASCLKVAISNRPRILFLFFETFCSQLRISSRKL